MATFSPLTAYCPAYPRNNFVQHTLYEVIRISAYAYAKKNDINPWNGRTKVGQIAKERGIYSANRNNFVQHTLYEVIRIYHRYENGEFFNQDSIHFNDSIQYKTKNGRIVYGGGGIMPDVFVARDTTLYTSTYVALRSSGAIYQYALEFSDKHRSYNFV